MSYDLAVWDGKRPSNDREAAEIHHALYEQYVDTDEEIPPTPLIVEFVNMLLQQWPELDEDDNTPWSAAPLIGGARGPYMYFPMSWSRAEEASAFAVEIATRLGLNCYDPQLDQLRTPGHMSAKSAAKR
ncbi:hypothetical protein FLW16_00660 [Microbispora sp. KK1-11]|nr:hypothetical protein FLW16_00660 [Microbispora sp. KK1-11]